MVNDRGSFVPGSPYRPAVDGLRGISVLVVALYHAFPGSVPGGFLGVDVFFVISGYLITGILLREAQADPFGRISISGFYIRRIRRLTPALLATSALVVLLGVLLLDPVQLKALGRALTASMAFVVNWLFYAGADYFNDAQAQNLLLHYWSLAVEEQTYLLWPFFFLIARGKAWRLLAVLFAMSAFSLGLAVRSGVAGDTPGAFFATHSRLWELGAGALLAIGVNQGLLARLGPLQRMILMGFGVLIILTSCVLMSPGGQTPGTAMIPAVLGALMCLAAAEATGPSGAGALGIGGRKMAYLGRLSYPFYLMHWPVLVALGILVHDPQDWQYVIALVLALALAAAVYHGLEHPVRDRRVLAGTPSLLVSSGLGVGMLAALGVFLAKSDGFPGRIPPEAIAVLSTEPDVRSDGYHCGTLEDLSQRWPGLDVAAKAAPDQVGCLLGEAGREQIDGVLWGDSHLNAIERAAAIKARESGMRVLSFASGACPPLLNAAWSGLAPSQAEACASRNEAVLRVLSASPVDRVTLVAHWDTYALQPGGVFGLGTRRGKLRAVGVRDSDTLFEERFMASLNALPERVAIFVLLDVPTHDFDVPQAVGVSLRYPWAFEPRWITRREQERRREFYAPLMVSALGGRLSGLIDPLDAFCPGEHCIGMIDQTPAFTDATHLSAAGADYLLSAHPELIEVMPGAEN